MPNNQLKSKLTYAPRLISLFIFTILFPSIKTISAEYVSCDDDRLNVAIKSNLLHDALLTPDFGVEITLPRNISVGAEGVYAWWSNNKTHRYWRIRGVWLDVNYWFGTASRKRVLSGHHIGIYGSSHDFDFEFGHKGRQARQPTFGAGVSYGYSFRLNDRLNLDLRVRAGYWSGHITNYIPQCGKYVCTDNYHKRYIGITDLAVTLVWFPGRGKFNNPIK